MYFKYDRKQIKAFFFLAQTLYEETNYHQFYLIFLPCSLLFLSEQGPLSYHYYILQHRKLKGIYLMKMLLW